MPSAPLSVLMLGPDFTCPSASRDPIVARTERGKILSGRGWGSRFKASLQAGCGGSPNIYPHFPLSDQTSKVHVPDLIFGPSYCTSSVLTMDMGWLLISLEPLFSLRPKLRQPLCRVSFMPGHPTTTTATKLVLSRRMLHADHWLIPSYSSL